MQLKLSHGTSCERPKSYLCTAWDPKLFENSIRVIEIKNEQSVCLHLSRFGNNSLKLPFLAGRYGLQELSLILLDLQECEIPNRTFVQDRRIYLNSVSSRNKRKKNV